MTNAFQFLPHFLQESTLQNGLRFLFPRMLLLFSYISAIKRLVLEGSFSQRSKITRCSRSHRLNLAHLSIITEENRVSEDTPWDNPHHSQTAREDIRTFPSLHFLILTDAFGTSCTKAKVHRTLDFGRLISFLTRCRSTSLQLFSQGT